jgi:hypothetical protein
MVCFRYIIVNTQHKGDNKDDDDDDDGGGDDDDDDGAAAADDNDNNNNNNNKEFSFNSVVVWRITKRDEHKIIIINFTHPV